MRDAHDGGLTPARLQPASALPAGARVQEFEIRSVIGEGGFGIVYCAFDTLLGREVAIKEYLPVCHALRRADGVVVSRSERDGQLFHKGLSCFVSEARMLARFKHPALVEVLRFWEENGTAYMCMPLYRGRNLRDRVHDGFRLRDERQLLNFLRPLLEGLALLHDAECFHRDISTDNILMLDDGQPVLLDFGAARTVLTGESDASTVILKPGFAPIEQYSNDRSLAPQGAWSDLYALSAVVYQLVSGKMPLISIARVMRDPLVPLSTIAPPGFSAAVLAAIDQGLAVAPERRPRSIAEFEALLRGDVPAGPPPCAPKVGPRAVPRLVIAAAVTKPESKVAESGVAEFGVAEFGVAEAEAEAHAGAERSAHSAAAPEADTAASEDCGDTAAATAAPARAGRPRLARLALPLVLAGIVVAGLVMGALAWTGASADVPPGDIAAAIAAPPQARDAPLAPEAATMPFGFTPSAPAASRPALTSGDTGEAVEATRGDAPLAQIGPSTEGAPQSAGAEVEAPIVTFSSGSIADAGDDRPAGAMWPSGETTAQDPPAQVALADHGEIEVSVHPWGNVYLNGALVGIAPPRVRVPARTGRNEIEIRNESHPPHHVSLTVEAGRVHRINHDFMRK